MFILLMGGLAIILIAVIIAIISATAAAVANEAESED